MNHALNWLCILFGALLASCWWATAIFARSLGPTAPAVVIPTAAATIFALLYLGQCWLDAAFKNK